MSAWNSKFFSKEVLEKLYLEQRLSIAQIAKKLDTTSRPIHRLLKIHNIPIRDLSTACQKIPVSSEQLKRWYFKEKMSMYEIAQRLGCTHSAIVYKFKKLALKSRGHLGIRKPLNITKDGLITQYSRELSLEKIARIFDCSKGGLERKFKKYSLTNRGISNRACKHKKYNFSENLIEKAYLVGFRLGDLNIRDLKNIIQLRCSSSHYAQIKLIKNLVKEYTTPHVYYTIDKKFSIQISHVVCLLNKSFSFLVPKHEYIPSWILENKHVFFSFMAGYSDAEGCFYFNHSAKAGKFGTANFEIQTQQKQIIFGLYEGLKSYGVLTQVPSVSKKGGSIDRRGIKNNKDMWRLSIQRKKSIWKLIYFLTPYLKHIEKIKKVKQIKENIILRNNAKWCRPIDLSLITST